MERIIDIEKASKLAERQKNHIKINENKMEEMRKVVDEM